MRDEKITELEMELIELKSRARNMGYKNQIPRLPKNIRNKPEGLQVSLLSGFTKRLSNWKHGLVIIENPGGIPYESTKPTVSQATAEALAEHFNGKAQ